MSKQVSVILLAPQLAKKADFEGKSMSSIGFGEGQNRTACEQHSWRVKPLQRVDLGTKKASMSSTEPMLNKQYARRDSNTRPSV